MTTSSSQNGSNKCFAHHSCQILSGCTFVTDWYWSTQQMAKVPLLGQMVIAAIKKFVKRRRWQQQQQEQDDLITRIPFFILGSSTNSIACKFFISGQHCLAIMAREGSNGCTAPSWDQMTATSALMAALQFCMRRPKRRCNNCYSWI